MWATQPVLTPQLCCGRWKAATDKTQANKCSSVPIKLYLCALRNMDFLPFSHVIKYPSFVCFSKHLKWKLILNPRAVQNQALAQTWEQAGPKWSFASCTFLPKNSKSGNDDGTSGKKKNQCLKDDSDQILLSWAPGECTQSLPATGIFPQHSPQWASNNPTPVPGSVNPPALL